MVVVKIELWPKGIKADAKLMAYGKISNDLSGTIHKGNYSVWFSQWGKPETVWKEGKIVGYPRKRYSGWWLLAYAIRTILGEGSLFTLMKSSKA